MHIPPPSCPVLSALAVSLYVVFAQPAMSQGPTGRTMVLMAPAILGQTATFAMNYPVSATGNFYAFLWSAPPHTGSTPVTVPGFTVHGVALINPSNFVPAYSGLLGSSGTVIHTLPVPAASGFLGYSWDLQSLDLQIASSDMYLADNELQLYISGNNIPANMMPIAAGSFSMGSNEATGAPYYSAAVERPVHQVTISRPFWMGKYEVTQAEYLAVMNTNPSWFQVGSYPNSVNGPVETVSWNDAMAYCAALTAREAAAGRLPAGYQYRLPTEAEWEYCCRAGTTTEFHYGISLDCSQARFGYSYHTNSSCNANSTVVVGGYVPNAWGLFDMHGNVLEWCLDSWDGSRNYPASQVVDPYVNSGPDRVIRGGRWRSISGYCRSAFRGGVYPSYGGDDLGFRVVLAPVLVP